MSRSAAFGLGLVLSLPLAADPVALESSLLVFGKSGDEAFGAWSTSATGLGWTAGLVQGRFPSGSWGLSWPAFGWEGQWAAVDQTTPLGRTTGLVWQADIPDLRLGWQTTAVTLAVQRTGGWLVGHRWQDWSLGAVGLAARGDLRWEPDIDVGDLRADLWGGWARWRDLGLAFGAAELTTRARLDALGLRLLDLDNSLNLRWLGAWARPRWSLGAWSLGTDVAGFAGWTDGGQITLARQWWELVTTPFWHLAVQTARTTYELRAQPGWVVVVQPSVEWTWDGWLTAGLSRCLPLAGGWDLREGSTAVTTTGGGGGSGEGPFDPWNLWWAGVQFRLQARW